MTEKHLTDPALIAAVPARAGEPLTTVFGGILPGFAIP